MAAVLEVSDSGGVSMLSFRLSSGVGSLDSVPSKVDVLLCREPARLNLDTAHATANMLDMRKTASCKSSSVT